MVTSDRVRIMTPLPPDFELTEFDVLCGRGKDCFNWCGNTRYRKLIQCTLKSYEQAKTKLQKSIIVLNIVDKIRADSPGGGGFVRQVDGHWFEIGDEAAREKVGQTLREALIHKDPSKVAQKRVKRAESKAKRIASRSLLQDMNLFLRQTGPVEEHCNKVISKVEFLEKPVAVATKPVLSCEPDKRGSFTLADEILAALPPTLDHYTSREWLTDLCGDSELTVASEDEGLMDVFEAPCLAFPSAA